MNIQEILEYLPQRYPFLMIDRILEVIPGKSLVALKNVTCNEHFFVGHFTQRMVMPGVLILEALGQAGCMLAYISANEKYSNAKVMYYLAGIDNARFRRVVEPGDQLHLKVEFTTIKRDIYKLKGVAMVGDQEACYAEFLSARRKDSND